ncbi:P-loop containing nucleoside triphosphate hydrolase protein [Tilletiaria anomala UBC 951]|uniref:Midasin n=1 Tax=Tilletiaria anomala (strain ATCC 24038 / CBS 436.72 / UBC 951) TaxID=1037660 RepID=A0A066W1B7_TILAU|nr:P-loop containing nucleoside triphosphate hydrolase protein [Tilletiaria anomala UBC 951]KDN47531.1 P-loop containing nucleoside triphosphate hydrolase protein [Tilletiaria anomala UBC 951]
MLPTPTEFSGASPTSKAGIAARYVSALDIDLQHACVKLIDSLPRRSVPAHSLKILKCCASAENDESHAAAQLAPVDLVKLSDALRELLLIPTCAQHVAIQFHPILLHLLAAFLPDGKDGEEQPSWQSEKTRAIFVMFGILLGPFEEIYPILYEYLSHPNLCNGPICAGMQDTSETQALLLAYQRILQASPSFRDDLPKPWPLHSLCDIYKSATAQDALNTAAGKIQTRYSTATRLLALFVYSHGMQLSESVRVQAEHVFIGEPSILGVPESPGVDARFTLDMEEGKEQTIDVWVIHAKEAVRWQTVWTRCEESPIRYLKRQQSSEKKKDEETMDVDQVTTAMNKLRLTPQDLHPRVSSIGGVILLRGSPISASSSASKPVPFVETTSSYRTLTDLAIDISCRLPILLSGPASSGKTSILHHVYAQLHPSCIPAKASGNPRGLLTIPLGDSMGVDAKSLLGSYTSSPTSPGAFIWQEGSLTRAVRKGYWVILEDVDKASSEVLSIIKELARGLSPSKPAGFRPSLSLGNRGKVKAAPGFMLFGTRSTEARRKARFAAEAHGKDKGKSKESNEASEIDMGDSESMQLSPATFFTHKHWAEVILAAPAHTEILEIISKLFPSLQRVSQHLIPRIVGAWTALAQEQAKLSKGGHASGGLIRQVSLRDLIKWCRRIETIINASGGLRDPLANPVEQEHVFLEALDIFLGAFPTHDPLSMVKSASMDEFEGLRTALASALAHILDLNDERVEWLLEQRTPEMTFHKAPSSSAPSTIAIGRVALPRFAASQLGQDRSAPVLHNFAMTKASLTLMEQIAAATAMNEPILLVGETGTGKTTVVQHLASLVSRPFTALNLSQQSEASDLLGGFKPIEPKMPAMELHNEWYQLFTQAFSAKRNAKFLDAERKALNAAKWGKLSQLWRESAKMVAERMTAQDDTNADAEEGRKRRKTGPKSEQRSASPVASFSNNAYSAWASFLERVDSFRLQHVQISSTTSGRRFNFGFIEGPLVRAIRNGEWILLDEINLAADETLDFLSALLQSSTSSIALTERGDLDVVPRHPDFRLFACMNPATDVGKKLLPPPIRSRFTELYVSSPDADRDALRSIVEKYIGELAQGDKRVVDDAAQTYVDIKTLAQNGELADGANQRPHFSIRTLARALTSAVQFAPSFGLRRSLYEGFLMCFITSLDPESSHKATRILHQHLIAHAKNSNNLLSLIPASPSGDVSQHVQFGPFWLATGSLVPKEAPGYILTPSVHTKLFALARAICIGRFPVLIQGPTSAGKTSAVEFLAKRTGHRFVRINNHEHTDLQEYLGSYVSDPDTGALRFEEGLLVQALRRGDWIVLDELNLAPTDVLEALNRLLDDNRELFIPETGETVKPHPHFMLFATQNPPGLYGGRKVLSRAFRNRFLEAHFDDVPAHELEIILTQRCEIAPSYASKMVAVFAELQRRRQVDRVFESKHGFATLRDLFRWGSRSAIGYEELAENGYMLLAERARRKEDKAAVQDVLESLLRVRIRLDALYDLSSETNVVRRHLGAEFCSKLFNKIQESGLVPTASLQRLVALQCVAFAYNEPVLLVGEPGTGKTAVCDVVASVFSTRLDVLNCHQNTDASDLLGGQRPLRNRTSVESQALHLSSSVAGQPFDSIEGALTGIRAAMAADKSLEAAARYSAAIRSLQAANVLFEWYDGPLILSMKQGSHMLLDEISLADDSVLERLNSVLETGRSITLPNRQEKHTSAQMDADPGATHSVVAAEQFQVTATMNPGGDYGKKELSPALRNRFTEIWVSPITSKTDLSAILSETLSVVQERHWLVAGMLDFAIWLGKEVDVLPNHMVNLRDYLAWATFIEATNTGDDNRTSLSPAAAFVQGAHLSIIEGLPTLPSLMSFSQERLKDVQQRATHWLESLARQHDPSYQSIEKVAFSCTSQHVFVGPYRLSRNAADQLTLPDFAFNAPTTLVNTLSVVRALQIPSKAILLEGSPGAGKTSLVNALAAAVSQQLVRINLSEQTEATDLFGSELPVEGGRAGEFGWHDAAFLTAMKEGYWVLLDEMNLASQSVLEGLNSCLDHRGQVYIPELDKTFQKHPRFRVFAAQNPQSQGGGRKGLPQSFLNRFTKVHVQELTAQDFMHVARGMQVTAADTNSRLVVEFNRLVGEQVKQGFIGRTGGPWELNLRDILRWLQASQLSPTARLNVSEIVRLLYLARFRGQNDIARISHIFQEIFGLELKTDRLPSIKLTPDSVSIEGRAMARKGSTRPTYHPGLMQQQLPSLELLSQCVHLQWLSIMTAESYSGKTSAIEALAKLCGQELHVVRLSAVSDAADLLGSFEHLDSAGAMRERLARVCEILRDQLSSAASRLAEKDFSASIGAAVDVLSSLALSSSLPESLNAISTTVASLMSKEMPADVRDQLASVQHQLTRLQMSQTVGARFSWVDGSLVRCIRAGHWVVLQDANQCPPAVLDRLNSLFEANPVIVLAEKGSLAGDVEVIRPHPNFRLFMTTDPALGELSRAMRNRGIEISLSGQELSEVASTDRQRLIAISRRRRSFLRHAHAEEPCAPAVLSSGSPFLDLSRQRLAMLPLTNNAMCTLKVKSMWDLEGLATAGQILGLVGLQDAGAMSRLLVLEEDVATAFAEVASELVQSFSTSHGPFPQPRDPLAIPDRNISATAEGLFESLSLQLDDRGRLLLQHLARLERTATMKPDQNQAIQNCIFYRAHYPSTSWPPELGQLDLVALLHDLVATEETKIDVKSYGIDGIRLRCDMQDVAIFIIKLATAPTMDHAALHSILKLLSSSKALKALPSSHFLVHSCGRALSQHHGANSGGGAAMDLLWENILLSQPRILHDGFQSAALMINSTRSGNEATASHWPSALSFLGQLLQHWAGATAEDATELSQMHQQLSQHPRPTFAQGGIEEQGRETLPFLVCTLALLPSLRALSKSTALSASIESLLELHGPILGFGADNKTVVQLLVNTVLATARSDFAHSTLSRMCLWDMSWCRRMWSTTTSIADMFRPLLLKRAIHLMRAYQIWMRTCRHESSIGLLCC